MFNYGGSSGKFSAKRVTRGITPGDADSYRTIFAGRLTSIKSLFISLQVRTQLTQVASWFANLFTSQKEAMPMKRQQFRRISRALSQECTQRCLNLVASTCRSTWAIEKSRHEESSDHCPTWLDFLSTTDRCKVDGDTCQLWRTHSRNQRVPAGENGGRIGEIDAICTPISTWDGAELSDQEHIAGERENSFKLAQALYLNNNKLFKAF